MCLLRWQLLLSQPKGLVAHGQPLREQLSLTLDLRVLRLRVLLHALRVVVRPDEPARPRARERLLLRAQVDGALANNYTVVVNDTGAAAEPGADPPAASVAASVPASARDRN